MTCPPKVFDIVSVDDACHENEPPEDAPNELLADSVSVVVVAAFTPCERLELAL